MTELNYDQQNFIKEIMVKFDKKIGISAFKNNTLVFIISIFYHICHNDGTYQLKKEWFESIVKPLKNYVVDLRHYLDPEEIKTIEKNGKKIISYSLMVYFKCEKTVSNAFLSPYPIELYAFINEIAMPEYGETIYTPFSYCGAHMLFNNEGVNFIGEERDKEAWAIAQINQFANELSGRINLSNNYSFINGLHQIQYDLMYFIPSLHNFSNRISIFKILRLCIENLLNKNGRILALLPISILSDGRGEIRELREFLILNRYVSNIILLPNFLCYNNHKICILDIHKESCGTISFFDASSFVESDNYVRRFDFKSAANALFENYTRNTFGTTIGYDQIDVKNGLSLLSIGFRKPLPSIESPVKPLKELLEFLPSRVEGEITGHYVEYPKKDVIFSSDYYVYPQDCKIKRLRNAIKIIPNSLIIYLFVHSNLKYCYVDGMLDDNIENTIITTNAVNAQIKGDEVLRDYLLLMLKSDYIMAQVENLLVGMSIPRLKVDDLKNILVPIPSRDEQLRLLKAENERIKSLHQKAYLADEGRKEIYSVVCNLRHMLGSPFSNISVAIENLKMYLPDNDDYKESLDYLKDNLDYVSRLIDLNCQTIDTSKKSKIDVEKFFKTYVDKWNNYGSKNFELRLSFSIALGTYIIGNETALTVMLDELLRNADKHGFRRKYAENNYVDINIELFDAKSEEPKILLDVTNNGEPFPKDFTIDDYITAGKFNKETGSSGLGGRQVYNICKSFGGDMDLISDANNGKTTFLFFIPANR